MSDERIEDHLKQIIVERLFLSIKPEEIGDEDNLTEDHGIDSVQVLEIVVGLEEEFGISFEDEDFDIKIFKTVKSIADCVRGKS